MLPKKNRSRPLFEDVRQILGIFLALTLERSVAREDSETKICAKCGVQLRKAILTYFLRIDYIDAIVSRIFDRLDMIESKIDRYKKHVID